MLIQSKKLLYQNLDRNEKQLELSEAQKEYLDSCKREKRFIRSWQWIIMLVFLVFWEAGARVGFINAFVFSSPSRVVKTIVSMAADGSLWYHTGITLAETFFSFFLILVFGIGIAVLLWWNTRLSGIFEPYLVMLNSLPKSALAPVFIVWLGANMKTIIVAAVSVAVFGTVLTLYHGFAETEEDKLKLITTLGGKKKDILTKVILPGNIPTVISLMKVNLGLALVGVIIGEFLAAKAGLGYLIIYASQVFKLDIVISSIFLLCVISVLLYHGIARLEKK
ncbi:MAG: ABC transporter permease [Lachnospiraceae bacterium]|nr:ABC transporter permease [Lachnospiraceae bacterium]